MLAAADVDAQSGGLSTKKALVRLIGREHTIDAEALLLCSYLRVSAIICAYLRSLATAPPKL